MQIVPAMAAETTNHIDYVAFGDSVAAGVRGGISYPGFELGSNKGYTDDIAKMLEDSDVLKSFNKNEIFCRSGMTAETLAINSAVLNTPGTPEWHLVKNAEIVTLDIGANDLLGPLYAYFGTLTDAQKATLMYIQQANPAELVSILKQPEVVGILNEVMERLNQIVYNLYYGSTGQDAQRNIKIILQNILNANKNVKIYIMGYYNPLPALSAAYNAAYNANLDLNTPVQYFNNFIIKAISEVIDSNKGASIYYVPTMAAMISSNVNLAPTDIHPTEAGYQVIANEFWKEIGVYLNR